MSVKYMAAVWDLNLSQSEAWVLMAYADHADHNGCNVHPGIELIAYKTGFSARQVQRITHQLVGKGILREQTPGGGRGKTVIYRIDLDAAPRKGDTMSPFSSAERVTPPAETVTPATERVTQTVTFEAPKGDTAMSPEPVNPLTVPEPKDNTAATRARATAAAAGLPPEQQVAVLFLLDACPDFAGAEAVARRHDPELVAGWATFASHVMSAAKRRSLRSLSGYLLRQIQSGERPTLPADAARRYADHLAFARSGAWPADSPWQPDDDEPEDPEPDCAFAPPVERDPTWEIVRSQLNMYRVLRDTAAIRNGDTLTVFVADQQALEWTVHRLRTIITRTVKSVDKTISELEFQVRGAPGAA